MSRKIITNLYGLEKNINWKHNLYRSIELILQKLDKLPNDYFYKHVMIPEYQKRLQWVMNNEKNDILKLFNVEEIEWAVIQHKSELELIDNIFIWKPWKQLNNNPPPNQWNWP